MACPDEALPAIPLSILSDRGSQASKDTISSQHRLTENECKFPEFHSNVFDLDLECDVALDVELGPGKPMLPPCIRPEPLLTLCSIG